MSARPASLLINTFNVVRQDVPPHPKDVNNQSTCSDKPKKVFILPSKRSRKLVAFCNLQEQRKTEKRPGWGAFFVENGDAENNYMLTNFACLQFRLEEGEDIPRALVVKCRIILQQALVCI